MIWSGKINLNMIVGVEPGGPKEKGTVRNSSRSLQCPSERASGIDTSPFPYIFCKEFFIRINMNSLSDHAIVC